MSLMYINVLIMYIINRYIYFLFINNNIMILTCRNPTDIHSDLCDTWNNNFTNLWSDDVLLVAERTREEEEDNDQT